MDGGVERLAGLAEALQTQLRQCRLQAVRDQLEAALDLAMCTSAVDVVVINPFAEVTTVVVSVGLAAQLIVSVVVCVVTPVSATATTSLLTAVKVGVFVDDSAPLRANVMAVF